MTKSQTDHMEYLHSSELCTSRQSKMISKIILIVVTVLNQEVLSVTHVRLYEHADYRGSYLWHEDCDPYGYIDIPTGQDDKGSSLRIHTGSCVEMHMNNPPSYESDHDWFWTMTLDYNRFEPKYNDRVSSWKRCGNYTRNLQCPSGTFVKKIVWDNSTSLRNGIELQCYLPRSLTPTTKLRTHGTVAIYGTAECTGVRGIDYTNDRRRRADIGISPVCRPSSFPDVGDLRACGPREAITGMLVHIENHSGFIKYSQLRCSNVGDIESICAAHDKESSLFVCDASHALYPLKCRHAKTIGYGYSKSQTEEQRRERTFYEEFGFDIGYAGFGLSANFHYNLGYSETTGYSWATTQENTFQEEITVTVEADAPAGCVTTVVEIIGECSFIQARPNFFRRYDKCDNVTLITDVPIPIDLNGNNTFVSTIPETVIKHLYAESHGNVPAVAEIGVAGDPEGF